MDSLASAAGTSIPPAKGYLADSTKNIVLLFFSVIVLVQLGKFVYYTFYYPFHVSPLRNIPGPEDNHFLLGQCKNLMKATWVPYLYREWSLRWPDSPFIRFLGMGNSEYLVINSVSAYREVLQTKNSSFIKPTLTKKCASIVMGDGLPFAEGPAHKPRRNALMKLFSLPSVKEFVPTALAKANTFVQCIEAEQSKSSIVEVESHIWKATLDMIGFKILGRDLNHLCSDESQYHALFMRTMQQSLLGHIIHYLSSYLPLRKLIPLDLNNDFLEACEGLRKLIREEIKTHRNEWEKGMKSEGTPDAIRIMMEQGDLWDDNEIVEYILNLLLLGHDTTACSAVWAVHLLAQHPQYQERIRQEVEASGIDLDEMKYEDIDRLRFLDNFIREVLRTHCPVAYVPREAIEDVEVAGVLIPKGTTIQPCPTMVNLHPGIWGPEAHMFDPDRWDDLQGEAANAYAFETFHNGPRYCIGRQLSLLEMKTILMRLVVEFQVDPIQGGGDVELASPSFTLRPKDKLRVRMTKR